MPTVCRCCFLRAARPLTSLPWPLTMPTPTRTGPRTVARTTAKCFPLRRLRLPRTNASSTVPDWAKRPWCMGTTGRWPILAAIPAVSPAPDAAGWVFQSPGKCREASSGRCLGRRGPVLSCEGAAGGTPPYSGLVSAEHFLPGDEVHGVWRPLVADAGPLILKHRQSTERTSHDRSDSRISAGGCRLSAPDRDSCVDTGHGSRCRHRGAARRRGCLSRGNGQLSRPVGVQHSQARDHSGQRCGTRNAGCRSRKGDRSQPRAWSEAYRQSSSDLRGSQEPGRENAHGCLRPFLPAVSAGPESCPPSDARHGRLYREDRPDRQVRRAVRPGSGTQLDHAPGNRPGVSRGNRRIGRVDAVSQRAPRPSRGCLQRSALAAHPLDEQ